MRVAALLSLAGGWLATGTAESSRLHAVSSRQEIETPLLEPVKGLLGADAELLFGFPLCLYPALRSPDPRARESGRSARTRKPKVLYFASGIAASAARAGRSYEMVAPAGLEPAPPPLTGAQPGITRNYESHVAVSLQFGVQPTGPAASGSRRTANLVIKSVAAG